MVTPQHCLSARPLGRLDRRADDKGPSGAGCGRAPCPARARSARSRSAACWVISISGSRRTAGAIATPSSRPGTKRSKSFPRCRRPSRRLGPSRTVNLSGAERGDGLLIGRAGSRGCQIIGLCVELVGKTTKRLRYLRRSLCQLPKGRRLLSQKIYVLGHSAR